MVQERAHPVHPERILLATDLSHRCDRALDRAADLARRWEADLVVVHAIEGPSGALAMEMAQDLPSPIGPADRPREVERRLRRYLPVHEIRTSIVVEEGLPAELGLKTADQRPTDLIVTGVARDRSFQKFLLGGTVDALIRDARNPLLVVKDRPRQPYRQVIVPTDFSGSSRHALETAVALFADAAVTVFHGADAPFAGLMDSTRYLDDMRQAAIANCHAFLASSGLPDEVRARIKVIVEVGAPEQLLARHVDGSDVDLVVVGAQSRGRLMEAVIGNTAKAILDSAPCDVLVVRDPSENDD